MPDVKYNLTVKRVQTNKTDTSLHLLDLDTDLDVLAIFIDTSNLHVSGGLHLKVALPLSGMVQGGVEPVWLFNSKTATQSKNSVYKYKIHPFNVKFLVNPPLC